MTIAKALLGASLVFSISACATLDDEKDSYGAPIVGVHHLGPNAGIPDFYVNKGWGGNVDRGGGGGGYVCCISIPRKWRPGLTAEVRWQVIEWQATLEGGVKKDAIQEGTYIAVVPVELYDKVGAVYVHFFQKGRARITPAFYAPWSEQHPVHPDDRDGGPTATVGRPVAQLFNEEELMTLGERRK